MTSRAIRKSDPAMARSSLRRELEDDNTALDRSIRPAHSLRTAPERPYAGSSRRSDEGAWPGATLSDRRVRRGLARRPHVAPGHGQAHGLRHRRRRFGRDGARVDGLRPGGDADRRADGGPDEAGSRADDRADDRA